MPKVCRQRELAVYIVVDPGIVKGRQSSIAAGCASDIAERPRLKRASAEIPEIVSVGEAEPVDLGANCDCRVRPEQQHTHEILVVHEIEEWKSRIGPRCG